VEADHRATAKDSAATLMSGVIFIISSRIFITKGGIIYANMSVSADDTADSIKSISGKKDKMR